MSAQQPHANGLNGAVVRQLKAERAAAGLTVDALAAASGVPVRTLVRYLNFERALSLEVVEKLATGLNLSVAELMTRARNERQG